MLTYDPPLGMAIENAARQAIKLARRNKYPIKMIFNGHTVTVHSTMLVMNVLMLWRDQQAPGDL